MRSTAYTPALTTATACSSAVTGVGAAQARGSQALSGNTAAFTPKPKKHARNAAHMRSFGMPERSSPPSWKSPLAYWETTISAAKAKAAQPME